MRVVSDSESLKRYCSWGHFPVLEPEQALRLDSYSDCAQLSEQGRNLVYGKGRSYGDCCLVEDGTLLDLSPLDHFLAFDVETGILKAEAGVSLADIIAVALPRGWFLPVTPGTKFVSLGGAIANDVHGKNHHVAGTFGCHVLSLELYRSDRGVLHCSRDENAELFSATIAGLGLTGVILSAEIQLQKVQGPYIDVENVRFEDLDEFFEISAESENHFQYTVAWLDCLSRGESFGRGIFMRGNHSEKPYDLQKPVPESPLFAPIYAPDFALNRFSVKAFNTLYYHKQRKRLEQKTELYDPFFYPLDGVRDWNKIYGKGGFLQFQAVLPPEPDKKAVREVLQLVVDSGKASFLVVVKEFGKKESPGMLSFPREGTTLCLDFAYRGRKTKRLLEKMHRLTREAGGAFYPAKDALMSVEDFQQSYPNWKAFAEYKDPKMSSSFWERVSGMEAEEV